MSADLIFALTSVFVAVAAAAVYVGNGVLRAQQNASRRLASLQTRRENLDASFAERAVAPVVERLGRGALRFTPQGWMARTEKRLAVSGWDSRMDLSAWAATRVVAAVGGLLLGVLVALLVPEVPRILVISVFTFMGVIAPEAMLTRRIDERRDAIQRDLPDVIDLLVISVEAGLGFEAALGRVVQTVPGELSDEFARMLQETRVGVRRNEAMRQLAERTDVDDLNSFILAINQADTFGVSVSRMLRVQADEIRVRRRQRAQEKAFAAPVKMVFPLVLCIFPSLFVVLLGPAVINIFDKLF